MQVQAINNLSLTQFQGLKSNKKRHEKNIENYPQMDAPVSKKTANALKNAFMAGVMAASVAGGMTLTSCEKEELSYAKAEANAWVINNWGWGKPDTIFVTKPFKDINFAINDSLISQGLNIGSELDGPKPGENVVLLSYRAQNNWDHKRYEGQLDSIGTNSRQNTYVTRVTDLYDPRNPKKLWMKTVVSDVPGRGIKFDHYTTNATSKPEEWQWKPSYSEIRSNGARGDKPGINTIYDSDGNMIWEGEFKKGELPGTCICGKLALDKQGQPVFDENGEPELIKYDFQDMKMCSREVDFKKFEVYKPED